MINDEISGICLSITFGVVGFINGLKEAKKEKELIYSSMEEILSQIQNAPTVQNSVSCKSQALFIAYFNRPTMNISLGEMLAVPFLSAPVDYLSSLPDHSVSDSAAVGVFTTGMYFAGKGIGKLFEDLKFDGNVKKIMDKYSDVIS